MYRLSIGLINQVVLDQSEMIIYDFYIRIKWEGNFVKSTRGTIILIKPWLGKKGRMQSVRKSHIIVSGLIRNVEQLVLSGITLNHSIYVLTIFDQKLENCFSLTVMYNQLYYIFNFREFYRVQFN